MRSLGKDRGQRIIPIARNVAWWVSICYAYGTNERLVRRGGKAGNYVEALISERMRVGAVMRIELTTRAVL